MSAPPPDVELIQRVLARASRRRAAIAMLRASTIAVAAATLVVFVLWMAGRLTPPALAIIAAASLIAQLALAVIAARRRGSPLAAARALEQRAPADNLIVTAAELLEPHASVKPDIVALVHAHAARRARAINVDTVFAIRRPATIFVTALLAYGFASVLLASNPAPPRPATSTRPGAARISRVDAVVTPPDYTHGPSATLHDPTEIRALAGSRVALSIVANGDGVTLETTTAAQTVNRGPDGVVRAAIVVDRDDFIALTTVGRESQPGKRLIGLVVDRDQAPLVRVDKPGRDLFLASTAETIPIVVSATDDIGLSDLRVTYTTVTGSGEDFTFREGELPLQIARSDGRHWSGTATLALKALTLAPGDTVVYRALAKDVRPGSPAIESDSFMVHLSTPDRAIAGGFTIDDDFNRYAISQQMVIVKTERLIAQRPTLTAAAFLDHATEIASEQRRVRAEFVFMMGGETEDLNAVADTLDETAETARESDLAAGRLQNRGAIDLIFATRHMSKAALSLGEPDAPAALKEERAALTALQRAFSKDRYLLRSLSSQQQLDESRRLGGKLTDVVRDVRPEAEPKETPRVAALRSALASIASLAARAGNPTEQRDSAATLARKILAIDPASAQLRDAAASLTNAVGPQFDRAALTLAAILRGQLSEAAAMPNLSTSDLKGSVADALGRAPSGAIKR